MYDSDVQVCTVPSCCVDFLLYRNVQYLTPQLCATVKGSIQNYTHTHTLQNTRLRRPSRFILSACVLFHKFSKQPQWESQHVPGPTVKYPSV